MLSTTAGAPTRLSAFSANRLVNTGTVRHLAANWVFQETAGIALNTEIELRFQLTYQVGANVLTFLITDYVETQATAIGGTLTFTVYWDSGLTAGVSIHNQLELSQVCVAVGTCP